MSKRLLSKGAQGFYWLSTDMKDMSSNVTEFKLLYKIFFILILFTCWKIISNIIIYSTFYSQCKFCFIALLRYIWGILFVLLILHTVLYFCIAFFIFNCIIWQCYVFVTVWLYVYMTSELFYISKSLVVLSVDHLYNNNNNNNNIYFTFHRSITRSKTNWMWK